MFFRFTLECALHKAQGRRRGGVKAEVKTAWSRKPRFAQQLLAFGARAWYPTCAAMGAAASQTGPSETMSDIFREVDEEVRRDKALQFWSKYQTLFIALALAIVAASAGWRFYKDGERAKAEAAGASFEAALQLSRENKPAEADAAFQDLIKQGAPGYALLARFRGAADVAVTDPAKAVQIYDALAADAKIPTLMQDVARLRAGMLRLDEADAAEIKRRLEPLAQTGAPFRNRARELLAYAAFKTDDFEAAGRWLDQIVVDLQAPAGLRQRAETLLGLVAASKAR